MRRAPARRRRGHLTILSIGATLVFVEALANFFQIADPHLDKLDPLQMKQLDTLTAMIQLLITLASGAAGVLMAIVSGVTGFDGVRWLPLPFL